MILIKNALIVPFYQEMEVIDNLHYDILIHEERIVMIEKKLDLDIAIKALGLEEAAPFIETINAAGALVAPGFVDIHVHFRDPGYTDKEDIESGVRTAARGGYTSVVMMANTNPCPDNTKDLADIVMRGQKADINVYTCANVTIGGKGREIVDMEALAIAGAVGFSDDGMPLLDEVLVREVFQRAAQLGIPVALHEEDPAYIEKDENGINSGWISSKLGIKGSKREAEITMVERDLRIAEETGATVIFQHLSTAEAVELIRQAKKTNDRIFAEVTPHHFSLTEEAILSKGTMAKMNPPLRTEKDRLAIIAGLADGTIDIIATDHAPHTAADKAKPLLEAPSGIIGLETALSLVMRELVMPGHLSLTDLVYKMSVNPAKAFKLAAGEVKVGMTADLVIFNPTATRKIGKFYSKSANSPFVGETMPGLVRYTIAKGKIVYARNKKHKPKGEIPPPL
ncbi:MAG: dihydroorotase [Lachnospiraceae bacterium]|jgi:dihydroorotase|nr:dihydroorotase [Lachnospiraceae bacterium]